MPASTNITTEFALVIPKESMPVSSSHPIPDGQAVAAMSNGVSNDGPSGCHHDTIHGSGPCGHDLPLSTMRSSQALADDQTEFPHGDDQQASPYSSSCHSHAGGSRSTLSTDSETSHSSGPSSSMSASPPQKRFNLASFANELYEHRLSVMHPRHSQIVLTEEDELAFAQLIQGNQNMACVHTEQMMDALLVSNPVPEPEKMQEQDAQNRSPEPLPVTESTGKDNTKAEAPQPTPPVPRIHRIKKKPSLLQIPAASDSPVEHKSRSDHGSRSIELVQPIALPLSDPMAFTAPRAAPPPPMHCTPLSTKKSKILPAAMLKKKNDTSHWFSRLHKDGQDATSRTMLASAGLDMQSKEAWKDRKELKTSALDPLRGAQVPTQTKSLRLFGSLRHAARARSHSSSSLSGLMRNRNNTHASTLADRPDSSETNQQPARDNEGKGKIRMLSQLLTKATRRATTAGTGARENQRIKSTQGSGERAKMVRRTIIFVPPDTMHAQNQVSEEESPTTPTTPATPVTPDSLYVSPIPTLQVATVVKRRPSIKKTMKDGALSSSEPTDPTTPSAVPYLEGLELREMSDGSVVWGLVKKQGRRQSFFSPQATDQPQVEHEELDEQDEIEVEDRVLRLMGLQQGAGVSQATPPNSSYSLSLPCSGDDNRTRVHGSTHAASLSSSPSLSSSSSPLASPLAVSTSLPLLSPPPIPKRSPFRQQQASHISTLVKGPAATEIYYAPDATLPSLLHMMHASEDLPPALDSSSPVEEQLDELMRVLEGY